MERESWGRTGEWPKAGCPCSILSAMVSPPSIPSPSFPREGTLPSEMFHCGRDGAEGSSSASFLQERRHQVFGKLGLFGYGQGGSPAPAFLLTKEGGLSPQHGASRRCPEAQSASSGLHKRVNCCTAAASPRQKSVFQLLRHMCVLITVIPFAKVLHPKWLAGS